MIVAMHDDHKYAHSYLIVIIQPNNLERMKQGDPITLNPSYMGGVLRPARYPTELRVCIGYEHDAAKVREFTDRNDTAGLLEYVQRGYQFDPALGDGKRA